MIKTKTISSKKLVGYMMYFVAVVMPLSNIPQLHQIYTTKLTTGLSISAWIMYATFGLVPLVYALVNRLKPLIISNLLWMVIDCLMIYGIVIYSPHLLPHSYDRLLLINNIGKGFSQIGLFLVSLALVLFSLDLMKTRRSYL